MVIATLGIGSNIDPAVNIRSAAACLRGMYPGVRLSPVYESRAVGFDGDNFLNLVAMVEVNKSLAELVSDCKRLEDLHGRDRSAARFSGRTLDIDVLTFGELVGDFDGVTLPRPEITENAFVLQPLADLLPEQLHPLTGKRYRDLLASLDLSSQQLWRIEFDWLA